MDLKPFTDNQFHPTRCSECGEDNPDGAQFCCSCGKPYPHLLYIAYLENEMGPVTDWSSVLTGGGVPGGIFTQDDLDTAVAEATADMVPAADFATLQQKFTKLQGIAQGMADPDELQQAQAEIARLTSKIARMVDKNALIRAIALAREEGEKEAAASAQEAATAILAALSLLQNGSPSVQFTPEPAAKQSFAWMK